MHSGDGSLTPAELYGGVDWPGLRMSPAQVQGLFAAADTVHDGTITLEEFKAALHLATMGAEEDDDVLDAPASAGARAG
eukprot:350457-Chlamydomonas_euryale.AAC.5